MEARGSDEVTGKRTPSSSEDVYAKARRAVHAHAHADVPARSRGARSFFPPFILSFFFRSRARARGQSHKELLGSMFFPLAQASTLKSSPRFGFCCCCFASIPSPAPGRAVPRSSRVVVVSCRVVFTILTRSRRIASRHARSFRLYGPPTHPGETPFLPSPSPPLFPPLSFALLVSLPHVATWSASHFSSHRLARSLVRAVSRLRRSFPSCRPPRPWCPALLRRPSADDPFSPLYPAAPLSLALCGLRDASFRRVFAARSSRARSLLTPRFATRRSRDTS